MTKPSKRRTIWPFFAAVLFLGTVALLVVATGAWQVVAPAPQVPDLQRSVPARSAVVDVIPDGPYSVEGSVWTAAGAPAPDVVILWRAPREDWQAIGKTDENGVFAVGVAGVGELKPATDTSPALAQIYDDTAGLRFVETEVCPLEVLALDPSGAPLTDQTVRAHVTIARARHPTTYEAPTDHAGVARFDALPCGVASVWLRRSGHPQARRNSVDTVVVTRITLQLRPGLHISGVVADLDGNPIEDARVSSGNASDTTDEGGVYGLIVDPLELSGVRAAAQGYLPTTERLRVSPDELEDIELDFLLESSRSITVHCAGLPDDSCEGIAPLMCTHVFLPMGSPCDGSPTQCECPDGRAAVRGGGTSVEVYPDDDEVWLDLRNRGTITGRVLVDGRPATPQAGLCIVRSTRVPDSYEDLAGGISAGATATCGADGRFELHGIKAGEQLVMVQTYAGSADLAGVEVDGSVVDVGDVEIGGGGRIDGVVLDGTTGEGLPDAGVYAWMVAGESMGGLGQAISGTEGRFTISGLDDGTYSVILVSRPLDEHEVVVQNGQSDPLELTTGEAGLLAENGFSLHTDAQGRLEVASVEDGGPASSKGLQAGDVIDGLTLAGMDIPELFPGSSDDITDTVLDQWSGRGVGLIVDRDGERVVVPLD